MQKPSRAIRYVEARVCWNDWSQSRPVTRWQVSIGCSLHRNGRTSHDRMSRISYQTSVTVISCSTGSSCLVTGKHLASRSGRADVYPHHSALLIQISFYFPLLSPAPQLASGSEVKYLENAIHRLVQLAFLLRPLLA